jgi:hypothetical protein
LPFPSHYKEKSLDEVSFRGIVETYLFENMHLEEGMIVQVTLELSPVKRRRRRILQDATRLDYDGDVFVVAILPN